MKRKNYFSFAIGRIIAGLLIGAIIYLSTVSYLKSIYDQSVRDGFDTITEKYGTMIETYDNGTVDGLFMSILCNLYYSNYFRAAKISDDGSFDTIYETDYDIVPVESNIRDWIYVTEDKSLLAEGERTSQINGSEWKISYRKCDEVRELQYPDMSLTNSWNLTSLSNAGRYGNEFYRVVSELCGAVQFIDLQIKSYYLDEETLHIGRVESSGLTTADQVKYWDFTDPNQSNIYFVDTSGMDSLNISSVPVRPDRFFEEEGDMFLTNSMRDYNYPSYSGKYSSFNEDQYYRADVEHDGLLTQGIVKIIRINNNRYLLESVITTVSYETYFKPFFIIFAVILLVFCIGIPCLAAIRPYLQYKRAYENNRFKNNLIDSLAHNLKTPLQIIGGYAENLKDADTEADKTRYSDAILAKITEMNIDIEAILSTADKNALNLSKTSIRSIFEDTASKTGGNVDIKGDKTVRVDKDYFGKAIFCLLDNAARYRTDGSDTEVNIGSKAVRITNRTDADKFTPGTGIAIAERILEQHGMKLRTELKGGVFEARITKL